MAVYDFFTSRNNGSNIDSYIGHLGRLFYSNDTGVIRISDGVTPGGLTIPYTIASNTNVGGIKAGPGVTITSEGQIIIDSANLTFSFGDFVATVGTYANTNPKAGEEYALLSSVNANEDVVVASNGNGNVLMVGGFQVHATDTGNIDVSLDSEPIFSVSGSGQVRMLVPGADSTTGAFELVGNDTGVFHPPNQTGVILHSTGNTDTVNRVYHDAINNYPIMVGRRYNGVTGNLSPVLQGETVFRIAGQASTGADFEIFGPAKINWITTEDQGPNNQGGKITIDVTANGTAAFGNVITAAEFTSSGVVSNVGFVGNLDATTVTVTGNISSGNISTSGTASVTGNLTVGNVSGTNGTFTDFSGKYLRSVRDVGVIADAGVVTIDFATDSIVKFEWDNSITIEYSNFTAGSVVKVLAYKRAGTGTDTFSLNGITAGHVSSGSITVSGVAGVTNFVEFTCIGTTIADVYAKL